MELLLRSAIGLRLMFLLAMLFPGLIVAQIPPTPAGTDTLSILQSVDAFTTLQDGQPEQPGKIQFELEGGGFRQRNAPTLWLTDATIQYTPRRNRFSRNMLLELTLAVTKQGRDVEFVSPVAGWQQRWVADTARLISVATLLQVGLPVIGPSKEFNATLTGILAKSSGRHTFFVDGMIGALGRAKINIEVLWLGYSNHISHRTTLSGTYVLIQQDETTQHNVELSGAYVLTKGLSIGPGLQFGLKHHADTPYSAGVRLLFVF